MQSIQRTLIHQGAKFNYEEVTLTDPSGARITRQLIRHPGAVVILPLLQSHSGPEIVFVDNLRAAIAGTLLELPAGTLEKNEPPLACAARELEEETGFRAATLTPLGRFYTGPGLTDELMHAFFASELSYVGQRLDADEHLTVRRVPLARAAGMIDRGELLDSKSIAAIFLAVRRNLLRWPVPSTHE